MKQHSSTRAWPALGTVVWLMAGVALAQIVQPLYVGNVSTPVKDALGRNLPGCACSPDTACLVEIREVGTTVWPPDPQTGQSRTNNPLVRASFMGYGVQGDNPGKFSEQFEERLVVGRQYFARVFFPPPPDQPVYFANSLPFAGPATPTNLVDVQFRPLELINGEDDVDWDGDGIPDAMENGVTHTSPTERDSDGDGWDDHYEIVHEGPLNANEPNPAGPMNGLDLLLEVAFPATLTWSTIPGLPYRLGYYQQAENPQDWSEVWSGTATESNLVVDLEDIFGKDPPDPRGFFRVWAVTDGP